MEDLVDIEIIKVDGKDNYVNRNVEPANKKISFFYTTINDNYTILIV